MCVWVWVCVCVQICTADINEYRANLKAAARKVILELEKDGGGPGGPQEWLVVYIRPPSVDSADKVWAYTHTHTHTHTHLNCICVYIRPRSVDSADKVWVYTHIDTHTHTHIDT